MGYVIVLIVLGILSGVHLLLTRFTNLPRKNRWTVTFVGLVEAVTTTIIYFILLDEGPPWAWDPHSEAYGWGYSFLIAFAGPAFLIVFTLSIVVILLLNRRLKKVQ